MKTFNFKDGTIEELLRSRENFEKLLQSIDTEKIKERRWFQRKNLNISKIKPVEFFPLKTSERNRVPFAMNFVQIHYSDKTSDTYFLPLAFTREETGKDEVLINLRTSDGIYNVLDSLRFEPFLEFLNDCLQNKRRIQGEKGTLVFDGGISSVVPSCESIDTNSTNSLVRMNYQSVLKIIRKIEKGINVEFEMCEFLTDKNFEHTPPLEGGISYIGNDGSSSRIGIKFKEIPHETDGFSYAKQHLKEYFEYFRKDERNFDSVEEFLKPFYKDVEDLAFVVANMHSALRKDKENPRFKPEKITDNDLNQWQESFVNLTKRSVDDAQKFVLDHPEDNIGIGKINLSMDSIGRLFEKARKNLGSLGEKTRIHNDLHLAQMLKTRKGFTVIDFEGEPLRSVEERAAKVSPLKDVAGMLRSFHYAAFAVFFEEEKTNPHKRLEEYTNKWVELTSRHFFRSYIDAARKFRCSSVPYSNIDVVKRLLSLFKLEKAIYELCYELNNRPLWVTIPVAGIHRCLKELEM